MATRRDKDVTTDVPQCYFCPEVSSCGNCMISSLLNRITALEKKLSDLHYWVHNYCVEVK